MSLGILGSLAVLWRPLLFSTFDAEVAEACGLPVNLIGLLYLVLVALAISIAMQVIGVLLVFALLVGPPATAIRLVRRPAQAIVVSVFVGLACTWLGILLAASSSLPISFYITTLSFGIYLPVRLLAGRRKSRQLPAGPSASVEIKGRAVINGGTVLNAPLPVEGRQRD